MQSKHTLHHTINTTNKPIQVGVYYRKAYALVNSTNAL